MDINRKNMDALFAGFKSNFTNGFQLAPETWKKFSAVVQSGTASNIYPFLEQFGGMSEWQSERNVKNVASHRIEVVNRDFEETVSIARNDLWHADRGNGPPCGKSLAGFGCGSPARQR